MVRASISIYKQFPNSSRKFINFSTNRQLHYKLRAPVIGPTLMAFPAPPESKQFKTERKSQLPHMCVGRFCPAGSPGNLHRTRPPTSWSFRGTTCGVSDQSGGKARSFGLLGRIWLIEAIIVYNSLLLRASPTGNEPWHCPPRDDDDDELGARK